MPPFGKPVSKKHRENMRIPRPSLRNNTNARKGVSPVGMSSHPLFQCYYQMIRRCNNPNEPKYKYFGAKGIKVCERWLLPDGQGFMNFLEDVGERPPNAIFQRKDNFKDYQPNNFEWKQRDGNVMA